MSTITTKLPQGELHWWRLRLVPDERTGAIAFVEYDDVNNPTWVRHTIYDGCEGELEQPLQVAMEQVFHRHYLYVLAYRKPSDADWVRLEPVVIPPPYDFDRGRDDREITLRPSGRSF